MSDNIAPQSGSRLLGLPEELRQLIYEQLFPPRKVNIHAPRESLWEDDDSVHATSRDVAVLLTCRTIYGEARAVLYENTEFHIRFACSGPDLYLMKAGKHQIYSQLLQDLQGRLRSLIGLARHVSLSILFTDSSCWGESENMWFQQLNDELARLCEAPELKRLHIIFEAEKYSGEAEHGYATIMKEFDHVLGVLSGMEYRTTAVTSVMHLSLTGTDFKVSSYFDILARLQW